MTYGGLRGAVAFCLAILLDDGNTSQSSELKRYEGVSVCSFQTIKQVQASSMFLESRLLRKILNILLVKTFAG